MNTARCDSVEGPSRVKVIPPDWNLQPEVPVGPDNCFQPKTIFNRLGPPTGTPSWKSQSDPTTASNQNRSLPDWNLRLEPPTGTPSRWSQSVKDRFWLEAVVGRAPKWYTEVC